MTKQNRRNPYLAISHIHNVMAEMRTPLLELKLLSQAGDLRASREIADQLLALFDSFLYAQRLEQPDSQLRHAPCSLAAATEEVLAKMEPFAKLYGVQLDFQSDKRGRVGVSLARQAFDHATRSLLHSLISSLQNIQSARLRVRVSHTGQPSLKFFSPDLDPSFCQALERPASPRLKLNSACSGIGSGLMLANLIYERLGSRLHFASNQHGGGFRVAFKPTRQMNLMESLS